MFDIYREAGSHDMRTRFHSDYQQSFFARPNSAVAITPLSSVRGAPASPSRVRRASVRAEV